MGIPGTDLRPLDLPDPVDQLVGPDIWLSHPGGVWRVEGRTLAALAVPAALLAVFVVLMALAVLLAVLAAPVTLAVLVVHLP